MSTIRPLAAIRYNTNASADLSSRIAPPYDVLDARDKQSLLSRDARNFVAVDLPHVPAKQLGPPEAYAAAARTLKGWLADGALVRDERPAIYVYSQRYTHAGRQYHRRKFFARLRLEPFGKGSVFPHERTFGGPKEDRLALMKATAANLSPIFGLYEDPDNAVAEHLGGAIGVKPLMHGTLEGVESCVWAVTDPAIIEACQRIMATKSTYIADGHHRYGTALNYRDALIAVRGALPDEHPANYVLCVFCAMEDAGLLILPTHRVLPGVNLTPQGSPSRELTADPALAVEPLAAGNPADVVVRLSALGPQAIALSDGRSFWSIRPKRVDVLDALEPGRSAAWRRLGLAFLHAYVLERVVAPRVLAGREPEIHYVKSAADAVAEAAQTSGSVFLVQPTTMTELRDVCRAADLMPQKSTYFFPKLASGLIVNPLE
ncbi:MAG: DUF1015 domain-containing protein [Phycisphaerae bacterium]